LGKMCNLFGVTESSNKWLIIKSENDNMWNSARIYPLLFLLYINDMPDSLSHSVLSIYADDTEIYASSDNCADLVNKVNLDLNIYV
jgi:hypothetical protein